MILNLPKLGLVRFDDNLSNEELKQQLANLSQKYGFEFERPERGLGTLFGHGVARSAKQMGSALFDVIPALGASALGFDEYAKKQMEEAAQTEKEIAEKYPAEIPSYTKVESPYQALQYGVETLGELVPTALGTLIPGGIAGGVGRAAATRGAMAAAESVGPLSLAGREAAMLAAEKAGATAGKYAGYAGAYLGSYAQNTPEIFQNIYEQTGGKFEPMISALAGGLSSILDSFVPGKLLEKLGPTGRIKIIEAMAKDSGAAPSVWKAIGKEAAKAAVAEGLTESAQEAISVAAEEVAGSLKGLLSPESIQRYKESFVKGAIGGVGFGTLGGLRRGLLEKEAYKKELSKILPSEEAKPSEEVGIPETSVAPVVGEVGGAPVGEVAAPVVGEVAVPPVGEVAAPAVGEVSGAPVGEVVAPAVAEVGGAPVEKAIPAGLGSIDELVAQKKTKEVFGLGHTAKIFREEPGAKLGEGGIKGLSFDNPEHLPQIRKVIDRTAQSTKVEGAVTKLETLLDQLPKTEGAPDVTRPYQQPSGAGAEVLGGRDTGAAARAAGEAKPSGVDLTRGYADESVGREGEKPGALKVPAAPAKEERFGIVGENSPESIKSLNEALSNPNVQRIKSGDPVPNWNELPNGFAFRQYVVTADGKETPVQEVRAPQKETREPAVLRRGLQTDGKPFGELEATGTLQEVLSGASFNDFNNYFKQQTKPSITQAVSKPTAAETTQAVSERTAPKELPLTQAVKGALTPEQRNLAETGNLKGLLQNLFDQAQGTFNLGSVLSPTRREVAAILRRMLSVDTGTKLVVGETAENKPGSFDPATNTITLNPEAGTNPHTLAHEASHALLSHTLDNPNHPVTKEVTNLYNQMKASSEGAYGATNVQEFAAEAWGNPEFRDHLRQFKPTGQKLDGWKRLINAVRRLFGFGSNYETAYDKLDNLLSQIISPAPESRAGETLYAQSLSTPNFGAAVGRQLDNTLSKIGALDPKKVAQVWAMLEKLSNPLRSLFYKSLNLYGLGNVGTRYFGAKSMKFSDLFNEMYGAETQLLERMKPLHDRLTEHRHKNPELHAELSKLATDATKEDVRPYDEAKSMYDGTPKAITWKKLNDRFNDLKRRSPETTQLYQDVFATFKALQEEFKKSLRQGIEATAKDSATALSAYQKIMQELANMEIDHYIPLYREGSYWLTYAVNGIPTTRLFKTDAERKAARAQAEANGAVDIEEFSRADQFRERNVPDNTMLASIMKIMKDSGAQKEDLDKLIHLVVSTFPETSILKSRQHRKGVAGYMDDNLALVFDKVTSRSARQIARLRYRKKLRDVLDDMYGDQAKLRGDASTDAKNMLEEFEGRYEFGMNPNLSLFSQFASSGAFFFNLAANVSSAVVQTMQVPMIVYPMLGGKYGFIDSWKALQNAYGLYSTSGLTRVVKGLDGRETTEKSMLSIENRVNRGDKEVSKYSGLIEALKNHGLLYSSTARDALSSENANDSGYGGVNKLWRVTTQVSSFMQHHSERMNREVTALAAYDLEMERLKNNKKMSETEKEAKAIQEAIRMVEYTHGAGSTMIGPSLGQSDIGKVLMVFKRFGVSMYYMLFDTMFRALPVRANATQEEKDAAKAARTQLVGIYGMAAIFAGAKGIPMYWMAELAYNMLRDKDDDDFDAIMRRFLGDFLYKGPVNYFTNLSIADRVGWADLIWRENKGSRADASAVSQFLEGALGAPYSMFKNVESGFKQIADGHFYRGVETMLPATLKNVMKGGRYALEGANTLRGDPVMGNINGYNAAMQVLGFAPADLMKQYEENAYILGKQDAILGEQNRLMKQYYTAIHQNDFDRAFTLREKLFELGMKYPELQINDTTLNKKVKARDRISEKMYHGVTLNDKLRARLEGAAQITYGGSFDGGGASGRF